MNKRNTEYIKVADFLPQAWKFLSQVPKHRWVKCLHFQQKRENCGGRNPDFMVPVLVLVGTISGTCFAPKTANTVRIDTFRSWYGYFTMPMRVLLRSAAQSSGTIIIPKTVKTKYESDKQNT